MDRLTEQTSLRRLSHNERWRLLKDQMARHLVGVGGVGVIVAILLIFFYLLYVVFPLFIPASAERVAEYSVPGGSRTLLFDTEELGEMAVRYTAEGKAVFFTTRDGAVAEERAFVPPGVSVTAVAAADATSGLTALGLSDGRVVVVRHGFEVSYPNDRRTLTPRLEFPYGEEPLVLDASGRPLHVLAFRDSDEQMLLAAVAGRESVNLAVFTKESSFLDDEITIERAGGEVAGIDFLPQYLLIGTNQQRFYVASSEGELIHFDLATPTAPRQLERLRLTEGKQEVTGLDFLLGGYSLMVGKSNGVTSQWFPIRDNENRYSLSWIRDFQGQSAPITHLASEERRKSFVVADASGRVGFYNSTAHRTVMVERIARQSLSQVAVSPRGDFLLAEDQGGTLHFWRIHNEHPEISWSALWEKVHYEGYDEPTHIWQSSSASNDFEPKFSLTPLAFGTLKAAFYAMLFAAPLAILGAVYTAYFMAPTMRRVVKPTIEIMEALPTVILGFLAGLWLAPFLEGHLPGVFALLVVMPIGVLLFAFLWSRLPGAVRALVPEGWEAALLIPVVVLIGWGSFALSLPMEELLFGGDIRGWFSRVLGIGFDQRNALVVGIAMGFAVIPTIFSITEDAIFSVPKHLTFGSLALGATPWQTLVRVVILTASPGIFSALMIGFGRAVGETMIVLMATGNTPVMDLSIFQGMRTLSANIAVEMPESEVASTHYRILFLAALVLFLFTFVFNTLAEVVRQRLRQKYSNL